MKKLCTSAWGHDQGTTAVEFAILAPVFITFVIGMLYLCLGLFALGSLHYAVEEGARCASVRTSECDDAAATIAYTMKHYFGPSSTPTFTFASLACGNAVKGTTNYTMNFGMGKVTVPLAATACFP